ncbi:transposase [Halalkalibacter flavus]|uniref:transposase n=1 Tax=Halalkalibacter flavus TaxID=3090668 RepID=UPI003D67069E
MKESSTRKPYTRELKQSAISDYLSGNYSLREVARKYELTNESVLKLWINKYNSQREIKDTSKGRTSTITKGSEATWNELLLR